MQIRSTISATLEKLLLGFTEAPSTPYRMGCHDNHRTTKHHSPPIRVSIRAFDRWHSLGLNSAASIRLGVEVRATSVDIGTANLTGIDG
jgi:hypothetical protein